MTNKQPVVLHCHSQHSFLDGLSSVKEMVARAKELEMDSIALTNHGNIFSSVDFYKECKKQGIKPIMGSEVYLTPRHEDKDRHAYHLVLLCENQKGWENLIRLTTRANENFYFKPRIDFDDLEEFKEGLIVLTACMNGIVARQLFDKMTWPQAGEESQLKEAANIPKAYEYARELLKIIGSHNLFLEVQDGGIDEQKIINTRIRQLASDLGLKTVATQDFHYVLKEDALPHSFLKAMAFGKTAVEEGAHGFSTDEFYIKNRDEWLADSSLLPEEVDRTREIADRCNVELQLHKIRLPQYPTEDPRSSIDILKEKLREGWKRRKIEDINGEYGARVKHELSDIESAGLADYFLIVSDITDYCRDNDIYVGPGRGSAAGALTSYLLGITQTSPIPYGLIWERFYNSGRKGSMPDIDTDIEKSRRDEVIAYIRQRFGEKRVAQIVTLSSLGAKQVVRDVFKVAGIDENTKNIIAGLIPAKNDDHASISLQEAITAVPKLKEYSEDTKEFTIERNGEVIRTTSWKQLFDIAKRLEGCYKTSGVHAAAVVIADDDFDRAGVPLVKGVKKEDLICGWDMNSVDEFGLLKVDILGIATLDVIKTTQRLIKERHGTTFDLQELPLNDQKVFDLLADGHNQGIFQLESNLGRSWSKKCKPTSLEEIAELVAIIRPACLDCLSGDVKILVNEFRWSERNSFKYITVRELYDNIQKFNAGNQRYSNQIMSLDESSMKMVRNNVLDVIKSGKKKVFKIELMSKLEGCNSRFSPNSQSSFYDIKATLGHRFLTLDGWKELRNIKPGDYVCVANRRFGSRHDNTKHNSGAKNYRNIAFYNYQYHCTLCEDDNPEYGFLDVNHLDGGNRHINNDPDNLCWLCPNHHRLYTMGKISADECRQSASRYRMDFNEYVMFTPVVAITEVGEEDTYDICMESPHNSFVAGGFIAHNCGMSETYAKIRNGDETPSYIDPILKPILEPTKGILLYQEQVMAICQAVAGMDLKNADAVRKVIGKKKPEELRQKQKEFMNGAIKTVPQKVAKEIWGWIEKQAGYGFNKSHAVGYAILAYWTAWFKANYFIEFLCANLIHARDKANQQRTPQDVIAQFVNDGKLGGVDVVPPRLRGSNDEFTILDDSTISFGFSHIRNVGASAMKAVRASKPAKDFAEFLALAATNKMNKQVIEAFISSGVLDIFGIPRRDMKAQYTLLSALTDKEHVMIKDYEGNLLSRLTALTDESTVDARKKKKLKMPNIRRRQKIREHLEDFIDEKRVDSMIQILMWEKHYLGTTLSGSMADLNRGMSGARHNCKQLATGEIKPGSYVDLCVVIEDIREVTVKRGKTQGRQMAFVVLSDASYTLDGSCAFPDLYDKIKAEGISPGDVVHVSGKTSERGLILNKVRQL